MFGYIRPHVPELRVRELERFRALYCGMCRTLGKRYGYAARFVLSYDFVFLAALFWEPEEPVVIEQCRCPASVRKKHHVCQNCSSARRDDEADDDCGAIENAAGLGVILAYHKLRDNVADEGFFKATAARSAMLGLRSAYKKAAQQFPNFDGSVRTRLTSLAAAENDASASIDRVADHFALLLGDAADNDVDATESRSRILHSLLYHVGRWIYILDARDDAVEDAKRGRANALMLEYPFLSLYPEDAKRALDGRGMDDETLARTLTHSNNLAIAAFELLPETPWSEILRNILYLGMPSVQARVLAGTWGSSGSARIWA